VYSSITVKSIEFVIVASGKKNVDASQIRHSPQICDTGKVAAAIYTENESKKDSKKDASEECGE
jgi:hypothetical protein